MEWMWSCGAVELLRWHETADEGLEERAGREGDVGAGGVMGAWAWRDGNVPVGFPCVLSEDFLVRKKEWLREGGQWGDEKGEMRMAAHVPATRAALPISKDSCLALGSMAFRLLCVAVVSEAGGDGTGG